MRAYPSYKRMELPSLADQLDAVLPPPVVAPPDDGFLPDYVQRRGEAAHRRRREMNADLARIRAERAQR